MRRTLLAMMAATALLAACSTAPDSTGNASGAAAADAGAGPARSTIEMPPDVGSRVFFSTDDSTLTAEGLTTLARQAAWLKTYSTVTVTIEGHCDERGLREYNLALGERRADMVRRALIALGIDQRRISTISYGKERPAVVGSDEADWAQNRRAVTVVN